MREGNGGLAGSCKQAYAFFLFAYILVFEWVGI